MKPLHQINKLILIMLVTASITSRAFAARYFVCGPDEDGCYPDIYQYCLCIPVDEKTTSAAYCLNFDNLSCVPLKDSPNCENIYQDQASCLATALQSEAYPPCEIHRKSFCQTNYIALCPADSGVDKCR